MHELVSIYQFVLINHRSMIHQSQIQELQELQ